MITTQNHSFSIDNGSLSDKLRVIHKSLFDGNLQSIHRTDKPVFGCQLHPEASLLYLKI